MTLNDTLDLGPLRLPFWLLAALLAALALKFTLQFALKGAEGSAKVWEDRVWTGGLIGFALWKLSPVFTSWDTVVKEPLSLLYLPGNLAGLVVGLVAALAWLGWRFFRNPTKERRLVLPALAWGGASVVATMVAVMGLLALVPKPEPVSTLEIPGTTALVLPNLDGQKVELLKAPGKVLIVNFWATWCPPCRAEIPGLVAFWNQADRSKVELRAVDLLTSERDPDQVIPFVQDQGMTFPVLLDERGLAAQAFQIESIPTTLVFAPDGTLVDRHVGVITGEKLAALVQQYGR